MAAAPCGIALGQWGIQGHVNLRMILKVGVADGRKEAEELKRPTAEGRPNQGIGMKELTFRQMKARS